MVSDKNQDGFSSRIIVPVIMATFAGVALVYAWTGHKPNVDGFIGFLVPGAFISYMLPQLIKAWKTGKLGANLFFTVYREKQPVYFLVNFCSLALANLVAAFLCVYNYLSIFGVWHNL